VQSTTSLSECEDNLNFLQVSGVLFSYDCTRTGSTRISNLRLENGTAVKLDNTLYSVATTAFLAGQAGNPNPLGLGASIVANIQNLKNSEYSDLDAMYLQLLPVCHCAIWRCIGKFNTHHACVRACVC
jgi:hypothetical protein